MFIPDRKIYFIFLALLLLSLLAGVTQAAPPSNDNLVDAILATPLPFSTLAQTIDATLETNEIVCGVENGGTPGQDFISSVWYEYTPTQDGQLTLKATPATGVNASLGVYTGANHPLSQVACQDEGAGLVEQVTISVSANTTYFIRIASETGNGTITVEISSGAVLYLPLVFRNFTPPVKSWSSQTSGTANQLNDVSCPSATTCFAVGDGGVIQATTNGGTSWNGQTSSTIQNLNDVSCPSTTTCFAVGDSGVILATTDGGTSWSPQSSSTGQTLRGVSCPTTSFCFAVGGAGTSTGVLTNNGGASWQNLGFLGNTDLYAISCPTNNNCTVVGNSGRIIVFIDQGINKLINTPGPSFRGVHCSSTSTCYAVGEAGTIWVTTDNGQNWSVQNSGTTQNLFGMTCSGTICFAVGSNGTIRATLNGGTSWTSETSNTTAHLFDISCFGNCWAVGAGGTILVGQ